MRRIPKVLVLLIAGALVAGPAYQQAVGGVGSILNESFESGTIQTSVWNHSATAGCNHTVESGGAAEGSRYLRSSLTANPPLGGNYRCEWKAKGVGSNTQLGTPYYYGVKVRVPSNFANDSQAPDAIMQLHHMADHHAIKIDGNGLNWSGPGVGDGASLGALVKGQWIGWCMRMVFATTNTGSMKVWRNPAAESDTPAYQKSNVQTLPADYQSVGNVKIGLYKTKWRDVNFPNPFNPATSPRVVEHDDVRVGVSFAEACGGGAEEVRPEPPSSVDVD